MNKMKLETLWDRVKDWARANNHEVVDSYGIVGVAPIWGYYVSFWFEKLGIPFVGIINLEQEEYQDESGEWESEWIAYYETTLKEG